MKQAYTKELLTDLVKKHESVSDILRGLGKYPEGGTHTYFSRLIKKFGIDTSRWKGKAHQHRRGPLSYKSVLVKKRTERREKRVILKRALVEAGIAYECKLCGQLPVWNEQELLLQIDHIDGDGYNNLLENLRFLCPNCHTQTPNFGSKNRI